MIIKVSSFLRPQLSATGTPVLKLYTPSRVDTAIQVKLAAKAKKLDCM